jgi:hypothetical protein
VVCDGKENTAYFNPCCRWFPLLSATLRDINVCGFIGCFGVCAVSRSLSTLSSPAVPSAVSGTIATKDESRDFMSVFPDVVRDLTETGKHLDIPDATKWFAKVSIVVR